VQFVQELNDDQYREHVVHCLGIQHAVVHTESPASIVVLDQEHRRGEGIRTGMDDPLLQHLRTLALQLIIDELRVTIRADPHRHRVRQQMYPVIVPPWWGQLDRSGEHLLELLQQHQHQVIDIQRMHLGSVARRGHSLPHDAVVVAPAAEARSAKAPPDGPEGS
jgi:hypothetical protein